MNNCFSQSFVSTYAGTGNPGFTNGPADSATFKNPFGLCRDRIGNIYVAEANHCIRKIDFASGIVSTLAGTGVAGWKDGPSDSAQFNSPSDLCTDDSGNVYVSDFLNQRIRKIDVNGNVTTIAGNGLAGYVDGGVNARFNYPRGICRDANGNLYVADSWNHRIRKIDQSGIVSTYAGGGTAGGVGSIGSLADAADTAARFYTPSGLTIDQNGILYVADAYNHRIRMIDTLRLVTTLAGSGSTGQGNGGYQEGSFSSAIFNTPTEVYYDTINNKLYISDTFNNRIRLADISTASVTTHAGNGIAGFVNDVDSLASFNFPRGLAVDSSGNVYLSDFNNHSIRLISANPFVTVGEIPFSKLRLYPNPTSTYINFDLENPNSIIRLTDFYGRTVCNIPNTGSHAEIDMSAYAKGIYFAQIIDGGRVVSKKIIYR